MTMDKIPLKYVSEGIIDVRSWLVQVMNSVMQSVILV